MADNRIFTEALEAIKLDQRDRARDLLKRLLGTDQKNIDYWLYMSAVVDSQKEKIFCLEKVLNIDPDNQTAARGMVILGANEPDGSISPVKPILQRQWDLDPILSPDGKVITSGGSFLSNMPMGRLLFLGAGGLLILTLGYFALFGGIFDLGDGATKPIILDEGSLPTQIPTSTTTPTPTASGGFVQGSLSGPTPLAFFLEATHTATPQFVSTPHPSSEAFNTGLRNLNNGENETAIEYFTQFVESDPESIDGRYYLGIAYLNINDYLKATDSFNRVLNFDPTFGPAYLGRAYANLGLNPDVVVSDDLNLAILHSPEFVDAILGRSAYRLVRDNPEGAIEDAETALTISPDNALAYHYIARGHMILKNYEEALVAARLSNEIDFTLLENYIVLGEALIENKLIEEALDSLQTYLTFIEGDGYSWMLLGRAQQAAGFHENAILIFEDALDLQDDLYEINYYLAHSYLFLEDYETAIPLLENAVRIFPNWFEPKIGLGRATFLIGEERNGYLAINASVSFAETDANFAELYYWRALSLEAIDEQVLADKDWNSLLELPPDSYPEEWAATASNHLLGGHVTPTPIPGQPTRIPTSTPNATATP